MSSSSKFREEVYRITRLIPRGKVFTYGGIAVMMGKPKAARAVGNALHNNPAPFYTPCYRVVNSKGKLAEHFGLGGKEVQKQMLEKDGIEIINYSVDLSKYGWKGNRSHIKNIVLDVGNVLVKWDPVGCMRRMGFEEKAIKDISSTIFVHGYWDEEDRSVLPSQQIEDLLVSAAPEYEKQIRYFYQHGEQTVKQFDYTKQWINQLHQSGYKVYVLSNYGERLFNRVINSELDFIGLLDGSIFSYEIGIIKPDAAIYEALLKKYDLKAEECLFFDDVKENVEAAIKCGFNSEVFVSYKQAMDYIESLSNKR